MRRSKKIASIVGVVLAYMIFRAIQDEMTEPGYTLSKFYLYDARSDESFAA